MVDFIYNDVGNGEFRNAGLGTPLLTDPTAQQVYFDDWLTL